MNTQYGVLIRFVLLYAALFSAFGLVSPFLPAFLGARGLGLKNSECFWVPEPR